MPEAGSVVLESGSEALNVADITEGTYGGDGEGEDVEVAGCDGVSGTARTPFVQRAPAGKGVRSKIFPTSSCLKVEGTSNPGLLAPSGRPALNNKRKPPI